MNEETKVADILSKLNETEELLKFKNISAIEKDLILEKLRRVYETVLIKNTIIFQQSIVQPKTETTNIEKPVQKEEKIIEPVKAEEEDTFEKIEDIKTGITEKHVEVNNTFLKEEIHNVTINTGEKLNDINVTEKVIESKKTEIIESKTEITDNKKTSKTLSDQYRDSSSKTVSDLMLKSEKDITSKIQLKPIKSIKNAISINDRIMFTKELFNNNPDHYNKVIDKVNNMNDIHEAFEYLSTEIKIQEQSEPIQKFIEIVNRRFIKE